MRRGAGGEALLLMGTQQDIHASKSLQEAHQRMTLRLQAIHDAVPDAIAILCVATEQFVDVNPAFTRLLGYRRDELIGRSPTDLQVWADPAQRECFWAEFSRMGRVDAMVLISRRNDGQWVQGLVSALPTVEDGEPCVLMVYRDQTEWRRLQGEAEAGRAQVACCAPRPRPPASSSALNGRRNGRRR